MIVAKLQTKHIPTRKVTRGRHSHRGTNAQQPQPQQGLSMPQHTAFAQPDNDKVKYMRDDGRVLTIGEYNQSLRKVLRGEHSTLHTEEDLKKYIASKGWHEISGNSSTDTVAQQPNPEQQNYQGWERAFHGMNNTGTNMPEAFTAMNVPMIEPQQTQPQTGQKSTQTQPQPKTGSDFASVLNEQIIGT